MLGIFSCSFFWRSRKNEVLFSDFSRYAQRLFISMKLARDVAQLWDRSRYILSSNWPSLFLALRSILYRAKRKECRGSQASDLQLYTKRNVQRNRG